MIQSYVRVSYFWAILSIIKPVRIEKIGEYGVQVQEHSLNMNLYDVVSGHLAAVGREGGVDLVLQPVLHLRVPGEVVAEVGEGRRRRVVP